MIRPTRAILARPAIPGNMAAWHCAPTSCAGAPALGGWGSEWPAGLAIGGSLAMRAILAKAVWVIAIIAGLVAMAGWAYFIWSFDWGHSYRGRGLWMMGLAFPIAFIFPAVLFAVYVIFAFIWELIFREKFPT
jgi:hypothetical protein